MSLRLGIRFSFASYLKPHPVRKELSEAHHIYVFSQILYISSWTSIITTPYFYLHNYSKQLLNLSYFHNIILFLGLFLNFANVRFVNLDCFQLHFLPVLPEPCCFYCPNGFPFPLPIPVNPIYEYYEPDHTQVYLALKVFKIFNPAIER